MEFHLDDIVKATGGKLASGDAGLKCKGVGIDSRTIRDGELFVAIRGAHFDGHEFVGKAVDAGARAVVVKRSSSVPDGVAAIEVGDTEKALGDMAAWWRRRFTTPCIAITGSNGKSTTKEMTSSIVERLGSVLKTEGNFNNLIGLPLTVFRWEGFHKVAVIEMGMNAPGEIRRLAGIARPDVAVITNVTAAHLEKLHSVEAVARAKGELFECLGEGAIAVVNIEDVWVKKIAQRFKGRKITFGMQNESDVKFLHMETTGLESMEIAVSVFGDEHDVVLPVPGTHNVMNALASIAAGVALGVDPGVAVKSLAKFRPMAMRFERVQLANGVRVVNDSYNANPESMRVAFRTVGSAKRAGRFVAAVGDMLELGDSSGELHEKLGKDAAMMGVDLLCVLGNFADDVIRGAAIGGLERSSIRRCSDVGEVEEFLSGELRAGDVLLVKGSRGMRMERVVDGLKHRIGMG